MGELRWEYRRRRPEGTVLYAAVRGGRAAPAPKSNPGAPSVLEGFSLHANTHLHANDKQGLERLCCFDMEGRYTARRTVLLVPGGGPLLRLSSYPGGMDGGLRTSRRRARSARARADPQRESHRLA